MSKPAIVCVDDQRDVLASMARDLAEFENYFSLITCESAAEALEVLNEQYAEGTSVAAIICDHVMPQKNGIDFLIEVNHDGRFLSSKMVLLTGLASHQDTITAINEAGIDRYIEKPWDKDYLVLSLKELLTRHILETGIEYQEFLPVLDQATLFKALRRTT